MVGHLRRWLKLSVITGSAVLGVGLLAASCSRSPAPAAPSEIEAPSPMASMSGGHGAHHAAPPAEDNGYIDGWFDGQSVQLHYTKSYFCAEPPASGAVTDCEIGAPPEVSPRPGPIPTIYAIAAAGFQPDPATVACAAGSPCLNHPRMIDLSRVGGPASASPVSHSHVLDRRAAGWFNTVNIRVFNQNAWNAIATAKSIEAVRALQGPNGEAVAGVISADTPTNIYFFIAGWRPEQ